MSTLEFNEALIGLENNLTSFAMSFTRNHEDAKDLTQETMLKAITYRNYYTPQTNFKAWVFTIMRNLFINQYRRKVKSGAIFDHSKESFLVSNTPSHEESAIEITHKIHQEGSSVVSTLPYEIAEQKGVEATVLARNNGFPLNVKLEPAT